MAVTRISSEVERTCRVCGETKPMEKFKRHPYGRTHTCQSCINAQERVRHDANPETRRWIHIRNRYGIDKPQYEAMLAAQLNRCAICGDENPNPRRAKGERYAFHIDHDHETGEVRGLLCASCNNGIGFLKTPETLKAAIRYLERRN